MRAVRIHEHGGLEKLVFEDIPVADPGPGEVRVRVRASGLNHLDLWVRRGVPGHRFPLPITPGCDGAGSIDAVGVGVDGWQPGDDVILAPGLSCGICPRCLEGQDQLCADYGILGETRDGTNAPYIVLPARNLMAKPENLDFTTAAAFPLTFLTAFHMLSDRAGLQPGETILIHAGGSGVSSAAIQIAALLGARIITTAGSPEKLERARELGAEHGINYRNESFSRRVKEITNRSGVDVVLDHIGSDTFSESLRCLARGGRYVFCGATSGFEMSGDFRPIFFKNLSILGSTMGSQGELRRLRDLVVAGRLTPVVDEIVPLERVADAHRRLENRETIGKIVFDLDSSPRGAAG
ncbi:MAG: zinc-binding dehydrogenase [Acidobacteriota bacterium]